MIRLILLIFLVLFLLWILRPFLTVDGGKRNKDTVDRILDPNKSNFRQQNTILLIFSTVILLALVLWILPKFGINFFALLQKISPIIASLRGILPF